MPAILKKRSLIVKQETTRGTFITMANADFNIPFNNDISVTTEIPISEGDYASGDFDKFAGVVGRMSGSISVSVNLFNSGVSATPPDISKLLNMCGLKYDVVALTSVTYSAVNGHELGSNANVAGNPFSCIVQDVFANDGGAMHTKFSGCLANGKIIASEVGVPLQLQLEIKGVFQGISDATALVLTGHDTTVPNSFLGATVSSFGSAHSISNFELDFGNNIELELLSSSTKGYIGAYISNRTPTFKFNPKVDLLATTPTYTRWSAGTEGAIVCSTTNWAINATKGQIITLADSAQDGIVAYEQTMRLNRVASGVPYTIVHT
jgi:hypothetical protein